MKLLYQDSTLEFDLPEDRITIVSIENKRVFRRLLYELSLQSDGGEGPWILNYHSAAIDMDKNCHLIMNPLDVDINSKSILAKLNAQLAKEATLRTEEVADIMNRLHAFYYGLEFGYPFAIQHKFEIGLLDLVKMGSFNFEIQRNGDIGDLVTYIEVVEALLKPELFILVNADLLLNDDELEQLYKTLLSKQLRILCLTVNKADQMTIKNSLINRYILDDDFCLI